MTLPISSIYECHLYLIFLKSDPDMWQSPVECREFSIHPSFCPSASFSNPSSQSCCTAGWLTELQTLRTVHLPWLPEAQYWQVDCLSDERTNGRMVRKCSNSTGLPHYSATALLPPKSQLFSCSALLYSSKLVIFILFRCPLIIVLKRI